MLPVKPGTCPECAVVHPPEQPHNQESLTYQYTFYDRYGRWPTWADAMAHCPPEIQAYWREALAERGIAVDIEPESEVEIVIEIHAGKETAPQ